MSLTPSERWGPFVGTLPATERDARFRVLRTIAALISGPRGSALVESILAVETVLRMPIRDLSGMARLEDAMASAYDALSALPSRDFREIVATYAGMARMRGEPAPRQAVR